MARNIDGEVVILDRSTGQVHQLNATASSVWNGCDGSHSLEEIASRVAESFEDVPSTLMNDVQSILDEFRRLGLLEIDAQN